MKTVWRIVIVIAAALLILGIVAAAIGYFTGGSAERMIETLFGSREVFGLTLELLRDEAASVPERVKNALASLF